MGMLDSTICDIYLVNDSGEVVGRPLLTACVDAFSGMCTGYYLGWEGGMYSLRGLMLNVIADKVEHCKKLGISISKNEWDCLELPSTLVTDMGSEYKSETFEQLTDLGVSVINLNPYRPDLKSVVEKFFDCVQALYKPMLKGMGVIESDFQERGANDYRKDARLTIEQFERVLIHCILYCNNQRIINLPSNRELQAQPSYCQQSMERMA
jgi:transposase InsO family protein